MPHSGQGRLHKGQRGCAQVRRAKVGGRASRHRARGPHRGASAHHHAGLRPQRKGHPRGARQDGQELARGRAQLRRVRLLHLPRQGNRRPERLCRHRDVPPLYALAGGIHEQRNHPEHAQRHRSARGRLPHPGHQRQGYEAARHHRTRCQGSARLRLLRLRRVHRRRHQGKECVQEAGVRAPHQEVHRALNRSAARAQGAVRRHEGHHRQRGVRRKAQRP